MAAGVVSLRLAARRLRASSKVLLLGLRRSISRGRAASTYSVVFWLIAGMRKITHVSKIVTNKTQRDQHLPSTFENQGRCLPA